MDNTRDIAEKIFNKPPMGVNSINLQLDDSTVDFMKTEGYVADNFIKEILTIITLHGIEIIFGHKNIMLLSDDDIFLLKQYTRSYGYELCVKIVDKTINIDFKRIF